MKVFYHNDNDGKCAAFLFWQWAQDRGATQEDFFEMNYDKIIGDLNIDIDRLEKVYFLDFHPNDEEEYAWIRRNFKLTIIDHHKTTGPHLQEMDEKFFFDPNPNNIIDESACGALLVWNHFFRISDEVPDFVALVDDWDRWQHKLEYTKEFNAGSLVYDTSPFGEFWQSLFNDFLVGRHPFNRYVDGVIDDGETILQYIEMRSKELISSIGFMVEFEGYKCYCLNQAQCNSTWFESAPECDIWIPFSFNGDMWSVSLYSTTVDVSEIAKKYGGGGHKKASGFVCKELPFVRGKNKIIDELQKQLVDGAVPFTPEQMNVINKEFWNLG